MVTVADKRSLTVAQWGDPDGTPILSLHGTPGSRLLRPPDEDAIRRAKINLITYDRPGYGASDRVPGRRVVDCVADIEAIVDALGVSRFAVTGRSGGGPHALAVAARLPDRVAVAECVVGAGSIRRRRPGLDSRHGPRERHGIRLGPAGRAGAAPACWMPIADADLQRMTADPGRGLLRRLAARRRRPTDPGTRRRPTCSG